MLEDTPQDTVANPTPTGLSLRQITQWMYALFAVSVLSGGLFGLASVAAVILAYLKRDEMTATIYASHANWIVRTFWWGVLWLGLSALATIIFVGWLTGLAAAIWILYRLIKGWLALMAQETPTAEFQSFQP